MRVGVIGDTHGLLRAEAVTALAGVDAILHTGDVGRPAVLDGLRALAPVYAVRGNNDPELDLPDTLVVDLGVRFSIAHEAKDAVLRARVVCSGHSHRPSVDERDGVLWLNPGSAGPRRFKLPVALALVDVDPPHVHARIVQL